MIVKMRDMIIIEIREFFTSIYYTHFFYPWILKTIYSYIRSKYQLCIENILKT